MEQKTDYLVRGNNVACNINVYEKNRTLFVRFDILSNKEDNQSILKLKNIGLFAAEYSAEPLEYSDLREYDTEIMDKEILKHLLNLQNKNAEAIDSLNHVFYRRTKPNKFCSHIEISYKLPVIPHQLINWVTCLAIFINKNLRHTHFQLSDHARFKNRDIQTDINGLVSEKHVVHVVLELIQRILAFKAFTPKLKRYGNALKDLEKLYAHYLEGRGLGKPKTLIQCVSDRNRCDLLYDREFRKIANKNQPREKASNIISMAMAKLLKRDECLFMFEIINTKNKILLVESCLGKTAHDGHKYKMGHTELSLIYYSEFALLPDGRMAIVNLDKNPAYLAYYAKGQNNFDIFHAEFIHWAKCSDLEIEPARDFHKDNAIIFTAACTLKLTKLDLHLNARYSQTLFNVYITWAFYTRIAMANNNFNNLAKETLDAIILEANPPFKAICNTHHQGFFHAVQLGKERGQKEYADVIKRDIQEGLVPNQH